MSKTDEALAANAEYARNFQLGHLPMPPGAQTRHCGLHGRANGRSSPCSD